MCRNRRKAILILLNILLFSFCACSDSEKFVTDTGSGEQKQLSKEEYLDEAALQIPPDHRGQENYQVHVLQKGTYVEEPKKQSFDRAFLNVHEVDMEIEGTIVQFGQYMIDSHIMVEPGDVIATVYTEVDDLAVEEAELKLTRLQERYARAEEKTAEDIEELTVERTLIYNDYERMVIDVRCRQRQQDWEIEKRNYEMQIADAGKELNRLSSISPVMEIKADASGLLVYMMKYMPGTELKKGAYICNIITEDEYYVQAEELADQFAFGKEMYFTAWLQDVKSSVISASSRALYGNLDTGATFFELELDDSMSGEMTLYNRLNGIDGIALTDHMWTVENVVLVPKNAVTVEADEYFVTVLKEDGSLLKTEFIPGGKNSETYWVWDGLTEGTQVIITN